ncbi:UNVERIFIED_CONTAM: Retrovirus-related Pol polyprotein from transposon [Sesamum calycinum]|uniref:Retrovirus-related Pol polyprotein from transposon n=1 Tax=Sesamum calycinum TaxID=2727403 RepID=A0AAW2J5A3_9LAMI
MLNLSKEERREGRKNLRKPKTQINEERIQYLVQNQTKRPLPRSNPWKNSSPSSSHLVNPGKVTKIGSKMTEKVQNQVINCLRKNKDIFAWTPQDLEGIDLGVITHHLNLDPRVKPVKQKKRHFGLEIDKIIQGEVNKLLSVRYIKEIQFPEWLSNVVLVPKSGGKWRMSIDFRDLNKACPKDFYPLHRIDQLVDSMSGCELLSMMGAHKDTIR